MMSCHIFLPGPVLSFTSAAAGADTGCHALAFEQLSHFFLFKKFRIRLCLSQLIVRTISTSESTCELVPIVFNSSPQFIAQSFNSLASISVSIPLHVLLLQRNQAVICYSLRGSPPLIVPVLLCIDSCIHCSFHVEIRLSPIFPFSFYLSFKAGSEGYLHLGDFTDYAAIISSSSSLAPVNVSGDRGQFRCFLLPPIDTPQFSLFAPQISCLSYVHYHRPMLCRTGVLQM